ncbi:hypothetical protein RJ640_019142 [Escallonia rubra]|uniref:Uncharacterized protein n=1 Tax=Escallonia rubra TaxID=112253 RepID=A0AA88R4E5_9ASTE|nr:hypothetical protein RJ640_019142 [Escallonia rubra]
MAGASQGSAASATYDSLPQGISARRSQSATPPPPPPAQCSISTRRWKSSAEAATRFCPHSKPWTGRTIRSRLFGGAATWKPSSSPTSAPARGRRLRRSPRLGLRRGPSLARGVSTPRFAGVCSSRRPTRTQTRLYSASFIEDLREVVAHVSSRYPNANLYAASWILIHGAVSLGNPFNLVIADEASIRALTMFMTGLLRMVYAKFSRSQSLQSYELNWIRGALKSKSIS